MRVAQRQKPAVHLGMQGLDASVHHLGETRQIGNVAHRKPRFAQQARAAAGRQKLHAAVGQCAGEIHQPGLVGNRNQGAGHGRKVGRGGGKGMDG